MEYDKKIKQDVEKAGGWENYVHHAHSNSDSDSAESDAHTASDGNSWKLRNPLRNLWRYHEMLELPKHLRTSASELESLGEHDEVDYKEAEVEKGREAELEGDKDSDGESDTDDIDSDEVKTWGSR